MHYVNNISFQNSNKPSNQEMSLINDQGVLINMIESRYQLWKTKADYSKLIASI